MVTGCFDDRKPNYQIYIAISERSWADMRRFELVVADAFSS
jgi:hypothetical protein